MTYFDSTSSFKKQVMLLAGEVASIAYSFCLVFAILTACYGELRWFHGFGHRLSSTDNAWIGLGLFIVLSLLSRFCAKHYREESSTFYSSIPYYLGRLKLNPYVFVLGIFLLLVSDYADRRFGFYVSSGVRTEALYAGVLAFVLVLCASRNAKTVQCISWPLLIGAQVVCAVLFLQHADGRLLFSDDHPSFLYRLLMLRENFPHIPYYNTDWNAGYSAREFYPSGVINVFLLAAPFIYGFDTSSPYEYVQRYTYLIPYLFMFIVPFSVYLASRILGFGRQPSLLAALFSLGPSLGYLEWLLKYGTLGFALSAGLVPLTFALSYRLALDERPAKWSHALSLLIVASLCLRWALSVVVFTPLAVAALFHFKQSFSAQRRAKVLLFILTFLLLNGSWMATFVEESKVLSFVSGSSLPGTSAEAKPSAKERYYQKAQKLAGELKDFRRSVVKVNPLLILLFVPGLLYLRSTLLKGVFGSTVLFLGLVAVLGNWLKPQLELHRMIIPISFLMVMLSGVALYHMSQELLTIWKSTAKHRVLRYASMLTLIVLLGATAISPVTIAAAYQNRSDEKYVFAPDEAKTLPEAIAKFGGTGRTFFLGFILHELGSRDYRTQDGGHVAPLTFLSGKELYASHYYHRYWSSIDPIPKGFRARGEAGIEEFLDLVNATAVVTFKREWVDYCQARPWYRQVYRQGRFRLFIREHDTGGYFLKGTGTVERVPRGLRVSSADSEVVIKYRYLPKLRFRNGPPDLELFSVPAFDEDVGAGETEPVNYIGIRAKVQPGTKWIATLGYP